MRARAVGARAGKKRTHAARKGEHATGARARTPRAHARVHAEHRERAHGAQGRHTQARQQRDA
eukprot:5114086-Pleurochrysis_carterae.AAC.1